MARQPPPATVDDAPPVDPEAVSHAYRLHRARRKARIEHRKRSKRAGIRFWLVSLLLLGACVVLAVTIWHQIQQLFGL